MWAEISGLLPQTLPGSNAASRRYERRRPEKTPLHRVVSENLERWLDWREAADRPRAVAALTKIFRD